MKSRKGIRGAVLPDRAQFTLFARNYSPAFRDRNLAICTALYYFY
ncbi:MAG: hypothetical protein ACRD4Y_01400 [Candidatus Acidiferrales bacterium]